MLGAVIGKPNEVEFQRTIIVLLSLIAKNTGSTIEEIEEAIDRGYLKEDW